MGNISNSADIVEALEAVEERLRLLCLHLHDELHDLPIWVDDGAGQLASDRDLCIYALKHFKPTEGLSPQETFACVGAVGCTQATLTLINDVNEAKDRFRLCVDSYLKYYSNGKRDTSIIRDILTANQYSGIKLKQVYRHIRYLNFHPRRISFTQAEHSSNRRITRVDAERLLMETGQGQHIDVQLAKTSLLGQNDRLVIRHTIHDCWVANFATFKNEEGRSTFDKIWTSLPIFFVYDKSLPSPNVIFGKKYEKHKKGPRADKKTEDQPFITSLRAYRYVSAVSKSPS